MNEMNIIDTSVNLLESVMIGVFLFLLFPNKIFILVFLSVCFIIIEFIYIQLANYFLGLTDGLFSSIDILICFVFLLLSKQYSISISLLLALVPTLLISISNISFQVILVFIFGIEKWRYIFINYITFFSFLFLVLHGIIFIEVFKILKNRENMYSRRTYLTLSLVLIALILLLRSIELFIHNTYELQNMYLILLFSIFFCIIIFVLFMFALIDTKERMKENHEIIIKQEFDYFNSIIKEKERYLNELKHNVNLYLNLLSSTNDNTVLKKEKKTLEDILNRNASVIIDKNPAIAIAVNSIKKKRPSRKIKMVYLLSRKINITQIDLFTILSLIFDQMIACSDDNSLIEISVEEIRQKCRIFITIQKHKEKIKISNNIQKKITKCGGEIFVIFPNSIIIVLPILLD